MGKLLYNIAKMLFLNNQNKFLSLLNRIYSSKLKNFIKKLLNKSRFQRPSAS